MLYLILKCTCLGLNKKVGSSNRIKAQIFATLQTRPCLEIDATFYDSMYCLSVVWPFFSNLLENIVFIILHDKCLHVSSTVSVAEICMSQKKKHLKPINFQTHTLGWL